MQKFLFFFFSVNVLSTAGQLLCGGQFTSNSIYVAFFTVKKSQHENNPTMYLYNNSTKTLAAINHKDKYFKYRGESTITIDDTLTAGEMRKGFEGTNNVGTSALYVNGTRIDDNTLLGTILPAKKVVKNNQEYTTRKNRRKVILVYTADGIQTDDTLPQCIQHPENIKKIKKTGASDTDFVKESVNDSL